MKTAKIFSSHGEITINYYTGEVISLKLDTTDPDAETDIEKIYRFNIPEYIIYWQQSPADVYDILNLGYWKLIDGQSYYVQPDYTWREEVAEGPPIPEMDVRIVEVRKCKECPHYLSFSKTCTLDSDIKPSLTDIPKKCPLQTKQDYTESNFDIDK